MARKWLSGALAFAMIFGCSAPVALADETPVEVVEVEQDSLEGVEQYASYFPSIEDVTTEAKKSGVSVTVNGNLPEDAELVTKADAYKTSGIDNIKYNGVTRKLTFDTTTDFKADVKVELQFQSPKDAEGNPSIDYYQKVTFTVKFKDASVQYKDIVFGNTPKALTVGGETKISVKATDGATTGAATDVKVEVALAGQDYIDAKVEEVKNSDGKVISHNVVLTGKASTDGETYWVKITARPQADVALKTEEFKVEVKESEIAMLDLKADRTTAGAGESIIIAPVAYKYDDYGALVQVDNPTLTWSVNDTKIDENPYEYKNINGDKITFTKSATNATMTLTVPKSGIYTGTFTIKATDASGKRVASIDVAVTGYLIYDGDTMSIINDKEEKQDPEKTVLPGATVDLGSLTYGLYTGDGDTYKGTTTDYEAKLTYEITGTNPDTAKKIASVSDSGVVTIKDNDDMAALLDKNKGAYEVKVKVTATVPAKHCFGGADVKCVLTYTITIKDEADKADKLIAYIDGEEKATSDDLELNTVLVYVGKPVTLTAKVQDKNNLTEGIDQTVVWDLQKVNPADEIDVNDYATLNGNVLTPKTNSVDKIKVVGVSAANPDLRVVIYILATNDPSATPIPEPTVQPTQAPTVAPTVEPTEAPTEPTVRTGYVNTNSGNLNIREAASTSSAVKAKAAKGTEVIILGEEGNFYLVQLPNGTTGYASKQYVKETTPSTPGPEPTGDYAIVDVSSTLRLRQQPNTSSATLAYMPDGATLELLSYGDDWCYVEYNGVKGYASTDYLTIVKGAVG